MIIALKQDPGALGVLMREPRTPVGVLEAQRAETSRAPESTIKRVPGDVHYPGEAVVFSGTYRNGDHVFWKVQRSSP